MVAMTKKDAEERMRPYLRNVHESGEKMVVPVHDEATGAYLHALGEALEQANEIIRQGVA